MKNKKIWSIFLTTMLVITMCLGGVTSAFAETAETESPELQPLEAEVAAAIEAKSDVVPVPDSNTLAAQNLNAISTATTYAAMSARLVTVNLPANGTLIIDSILPAGGTTELYHSDGDQLFINYTRRDYVGTNHYRQFYNLPKGQYIVLFYTDDTDDAGVFSYFTATYAPAGVTAPNNTGNTYFLGKSSNSTAASFKLTAPANGYYTVAMGDTSGGSASVVAKTTGFSATLSFASDRYIAVKKGQTYTFTVTTSTPVYGIKVKFTSVTESKYSSKKSKAPSIKKNKTQKGLMITGAQKTHWYKVKNPKKQKVTLALSTLRLGSTGTSSGGIKVTFYSGKQKVSSSYYYYNSSGTMKVFNSGKKLKKGTYYIKVTPIGKGTGYYTIKWK